MNNIRPEIMYAEQERRYYNLLDEAVEQYEAAERYIDDDPDSIPDIVPDYILADALRALYAERRNAVAMQRVFMEYWKRMRSMAIDATIGRS